MCGLTVNYTQQNYGTLIEKLAFERGKSFIGATTNLHQQNPCMTSRIIFVPFLIVPFTIYCIRNSLMCVPIRKVLFSFLQYQLFLKCSYCHHIVYCQAIPNCVQYFLMYQVLFIASAITPVSAIAQFYLFLFTVSVTYQNLVLLSLQYSYQVGRFYYQLPISGPSISVVIVSATPLSYICHLFT